MKADERPTKKQRELLSFIDGFIKGNGYGPSYREVMRALEYKSVSTVATHIDGLIARGYLRKKDNSARTLEVISVDFKPENSLSPEDTVLQLRFEAAIKKIQQQDDETAKHQISLLLEAATLLEIDLSVCDL